VIGLGVDGLDWVLTDWASGSSQPEMFSKIKKMGLRNSTPASGFQIDAKMMKFHTSFFIAVFYNPDDIFTPVS
jgi:hypothetical protein